MDGNMVGNDGSSEGLVGIDVGVKEGAIVGVPVEVEVGDEEIFASSSAHPFFI